jgi:ornithine carbamoyltransferase
MGQEDQADKEKEFAGFEVNAGLLSNAAHGHIVLHCLPAYRGKEISNEVLELHADTIFQQAENRLHAQKAILVAIRR